MAQRQHILAELKKTRRRRQRRPAAEFIPPVELKIKRSAENRIIDNHQNVLYRIEEALTQAYEEDPQVDDKMVSYVLKAVIRNQPLTGRTAQKLANALWKVRQMNPELATDTWLDALRVVHASVCRHSSCRNGDVEYLQFAARFIH